MNMTEYFFAGYRLLTDAAMDQQASMQHLSLFKDRRKYTHTFLLHAGSSADKKSEEIENSPAVCETASFSIHRRENGWAFIKKDGQTIYAESPLLLCSRDYGEATLYLSDQPYYNVALKQLTEPPVPFSSLIRMAFESGIALRDGLSMHASLVEKDGWGVLFVGPSGTGKSTQAKLWAQYLNAEFLNGDRPCLRKLDGKWMGFGMPWDGKDGLFSQKGAPVRAVISLEQADENKIVRLNSQQAMEVLLRQAMMPMWDDAAMDSAVAQMYRISEEIPFYCLRNRPERESAELAYASIWRDMD